MSIHLCYLGLYCTIPSYRSTCFAARDDAYDAMLGLHHNAELQVLQLCFLHPPTAADDGDFLDFSNDDIFFSSAFSFSNNNDDDRALYDL